MAVAIVVDEGAAIAPGLARPGDAGFFAYVGESAVAIVVVQDIFSVVGDVEIFPAVVVIVADANALAPTGVSEAGFFRDVGEGAVVIIVVKMACGCFTGGSVEAGAVDDKYVGPAVVVVVEDGDSRSGSFKDVFFGVHAAEHHWVRETCFLGDIGEMSEGLRIAFRELTCAEENGKRQEQSKRDPRGFETEERTMSRTGNHELLAY